MGSIVEALRGARELRGMSQADVARQVGTSQSAVARLENGGADPLLGTAQRHARAVGLRLIAVAAAPRPHLPRTAEAVASGVAAGKPDQSLRHVIQLLDDLDALGHPCVREVLRLEPDSTGSPRWDALLGGACEYAAHRAGVPTPGWTAAPSRFLDELWVPVGDILGHLPSGLACTAFATSPAAFAIRGVLIDPATLCSV